MRIYNFNVYKVDYIIDKTFTLLWEAKEEIERDDNRERRVNYMIIDILLDTIMKLYDFKDYQIPIFSAYAEEIKEIKKEFEKEVLFSDDTDALYDSFIHICVKLRKIHKDLKDRLINIKTDTD